MISSGLGIAIQGLNTATQRHFAATKEIAQGNLDPEPIVEGLAAQRDVQANLKNIESQLEIQDTVLDILA